jgi:hypothetical protein
VTTKHGTFTGLDQHLAGTERAHPPVSGNALDLPRRQRRKHMVDARMERQRNWLSCLGHGDVSESWKNRSYNLSVLSGEPTVSTQPM